MRGREATSTSRRTRRFAVRTAIAVPAAITAFGLFAAAGPAPAVHAATPQTVRVSMIGFTFKPASVTINAGDTVKWTYDETPLTLFPSPGCESPIFQIPGSPVRCPGHSTTSLTTVNGRPLWDSGVHRASGYPFSFTFQSAGTFNYICVVHGGAHPNNPITHMNGVVLVRAAAASTNEGGEPPSGQGSGSVAAAAASPAPLVGAPNTGAGVAGSLALLLMALGGGTLVAGRRRG